MSTIPLEIVFKIQNFLPVNPLIYCRLALVSKSFYAAFTSDTAWKDLNPYGVKSRVLDSLYAHSNIVDLMFIRAAWHEEGPYLGIDSSFHQNCQRNNLFVKLSMAYKTGKSPRVSSPELMRCEIVIVSGNLISCGSKKLRNRRDLSLLAAKHGASPERLDKKFYHDREIMLALIKNHGPNSVPHIPHTLLGDLNFIKEAIEYIPDCYPLLSPQLRSDRKLIESVMAQDPRMFSYTLLRDDAELVKKFVSLLGSNIRFVNENFRNDPTMVKIAIKLDPSVFRYISQSLRDSPRFLKELIDTNTLVVGYFPLSARKNLSIMMYAVSKDGMLIRYAPEYLRNTNNQLVEAAVKENGMALCHTPNFKSNRAIVTMASLETPVALFFAAKYIRNDVLFIMQALCPKWEHLYANYAKGIYDSYEVGLEHRADYLSKRTRRSGNFDRLNCVHKDMLKKHRAPRPAEKALWLLYIVDTVMKSGRIDAYHQRNLELLKDRLMEGADSPSKRTRVE